MGAPADNEEAIRAFFDRLIGSATKREIMDANPGMSQRTLERILSKLQQEGMIVTYMLGIIDACYRELANRFSLVGAPSGNEEAIRAFFDRLFGSATKREILDANPGMSQRTLERILSKLQQEGMIEKIGAARSTAYRRR